MKKPYYTSNTLVEAVKRKISMPLTQVTFSPDDILQFAFEELMLEQVPSILQYHEEYFVYNQTIKIQPNQSRYNIPDRAIGMRLRDVFYVNEQNQLCQMSRISPDDKNFFELSSGPIIYPIHYYIENNSIVLVPKIHDNPVGSIQMSYFLRPNTLVPDEDAAICTSISKNITIHNDNIVLGDKISFGTLVLEAGVDFNIGVNSTETSNNLVAKINSYNDPYLYALNNNSIGTYFYHNRNLKVVSSNQSGIEVQQTITVNSNLVPEKIQERTMVDILQMEAGHSTLSFDVLLGGNSVSETTITLKEDQLPEGFVVGDYICARFESIVPQIPTDLHNLLAERTCSRILASIGDQEGQASTEAKIQRLEGRQQVIIDNRVDGAPLKVTNFNGLLRQTRSGFRGRRR